MIKTTRIKTVQAPKITVYDLSPQTDGEKTTFDLPVSISDQNEHYLLFNTTVYKNDANHTFYTLSDDGTKITTLFSFPPQHGDNHALQFVVNGDVRGGDSDFVTRAEMNAAIQEAINNLTENN